MLAAALCKCKILQELYLHHNQITEKGHVYNMFGLLPRPLLFLSS